MFSSYSETRRALDSGQSTCVALVQHYLTQIAANAQLNAFNEVFSQDELLARAQEIDAKLASGKAGKLAGMVIAIKDNICYKGHICSASSRILENFTSLFDATVITRLLAEDVIIIGRLNCDEFAMGGSNENSAFGVVRNPLDINRVPGGSSGGSAAAVAAGLCLAALGSDTGGSIRQPASFTGLVGLKPTYGRISRWGLIAYGSSFDQIGPLTNNTADAALLLEVMAGADEYDSTASSKPVSRYSSATGSGTKRKIAYLKDCLEAEGLDPEVKEAHVRLIEGLRKMGHEVTPVEFPFLKYVVPAYYVLTTAEASSNLSRYDGIHAGYRSQAAVDLLTTYTKSRTEGFGEEVKRRIMLGTFVLSAGYYDAYYSKAQKVRRVIRDKMDEILAAADAVMLPTTPHPAFEIGKNATDPIAMYLEDIFTVQANLSGHPAISLPLHRHSNGLPFGSQFIGRKFDEQTLFDLSSDIERNLGFSTKNG